MTMMDIEVVDLTSFVGDMDIPCDYTGDKSTVCKGEPARWALHLKPCCPTGAGVRLACGPCKDLRLLGSGAVQCHHCGHVSIPAREAYSYIEPLERK